jgi:hypothetical protein
MTYLILSTFGLNTDLIEPLNWFGFNYSDDKKGEKFHSV